MEKGILITFLLFHSLLGSPCDNKGEDGFYCDGSLLIKCVDGDETYSISCSLGCNETTPLKTMCLGSSSCFYGYPGSFCEMQQASDGSYSHGITICHRNGLQRHYSCKNGCEQLTDSFARCIQDEGCTEIQTTSKTFGYCPTPKHAVHQNANYDMALNDALAREFHQELMLKSPYCPFMAYLTSCNVVYTECTSDSVFAPNDQSVCLTNCNNYLECSRMSGASISLDCELLCCAHSVSVLLLLLFILVVL